MGVANIERISVYLFKVMGSIWVNCGAQALKKFEGSGAEVKNSP